MAAIIGAGANPLDRRLSERGKVRPISTPQTPTQAPGAPAKQPRPRFRLSWPLVVLGIGLLVLNIWLGRHATQAPSRVRVPYSPFFLNEVSGGNVASITS